jgi:hypothetical protein
MRKSPVERAGRQSQRCVGDILRWVTSCDPARAYDLETTCSNEDNSAADAADAMVGGMEAPELSYPQLLGVFSVNTSRVTQSFIHSTAAA